MKTVAIICEYDPFHCGHEKQINIIKDHFGSDTTIISIMSGSTVQRGRLSVYPKHVRAEAAVKNGSDLVLELPFPFCSSSAEHFAAAGVMIASSLTGIDALAFGSENGSIDSLTSAAKVITSEKYLNAIRENGKNGHIKTASEIFSSIAGGGFPVTPNDILAVEYIAAIIREGADISPFTYKREEGFSATLSRKLIYEKADPSEMIPKSALSVFEKALPTDPSPYEAAALHTIRTADVDTLSSYYLMNGGVSGLIKANADNAVTLDDLVSLCTNKTYTASRIRRAILSATLRVKSSAPVDPPLFTNLLAANEKGRRYLHNVKKTAKIDIITKPADGLLLSEKARAQFEASIMADKLMALCKKEAATEVFKRMPYII